MMARAGEGGGGEQQEYFVGYQTLSNLLSSAFNTFKMINLIFSMNDSGGYKECNINFKGNTQLFIKLYLPISGFKGSFPRNAISISLAILSAPPVLGGNISDDT